MGDIKFGVVLVTFNRIKCLETALIRYEEQTLPPVFILVVDNASSDGTAEYLREWGKNPSTKYKKIVITQEKNIGGSGGFSVGINEAAKMDCDFLFLADDDAYAEPDMFERLGNGLKQIQDEKMVAICTSVINNGRYEQRSVLKKGFSRVSLVPVSLADYKKEYFRIDVLTFVGAAIRKDVIKKIGSPAKEYFIYHDDTEYSMRLLKEGTIYCIPSATMHHDIGNHDARTDTWRGYYNTRNWIDLIHRHFPIRYYYGAVLDKYVKKGSVLAYIFRKRPKKFRKMHIVAIKDAMHRNLGINDIYNPTKFRDAF